MSSRTGRGERGPPGRARLRILRRPVRHDECVGYFDRFRRRFAPQLSAPRAVVSSAAIPEPTRAAAPGVLPGVGSARVGEVDLPEGRPVHADASFLMKGQDPLAPTLWITDEPVEGAPHVWERLAAAFPTTGLWPLLCGSPAGQERSPWDDGELAPAPESAIDGDAEQVLRAHWTDGWAADGPSIAPFHGDFPGLARPMPAPETPPVLVDLGLPQSARIGLVACRRAADAPALVGWLGMTNLMGAAPLSTVLRS